MSDVAKEITLTWTDVNQNKNKFYHVELSTSGNVTARYGRIGEQGRTVQCGMGEMTYDRVVREKMRKGYKEAPVVSNTSQVKNASLREAASKTLLAQNSDPRLVALIDRLVAVNAHEILSASGGKLTVDDGQIRTPLGLLTKSAIHDARNILQDLERHPKKRRSVLADYMTLVPQNVGRGREWMDTFLTTPEELTAQANFLNQLEQSLEFSKTQNASSVEDDTSYDDLFRYNITPMDDDKVFSTLLKAFKSTRQQGHSYSLYNAKLENIFVFADPEADKAFDTTSTKIGNVIQAWHGTRAMNLLSIASKGLKSPREMGSLATTGAMFGRGIYSSTCSTKSLGYADAGVWGGSRTDKHYMFAVDVALGNTYKVGYGYISPNECERILDGKTKDSHNKPYHSISAESGAMNLRNPETIVPTASQMKIKYLLEFTSN